MTSKILRLVMIMACGALIAPLRGADIDTDGDGVVDAEEIAQGTDPANSQSVKLRALGSWRFSNGTLAGDEGQQPIAQNNVSITASGFQGPGAQFLSIPGSVSLKYRAAEPSGRPNISPVRGSILFRLRANWTSGAGPGVWVTVLQTTNFTLRINPAGNQLVLTSKSGPTTVTNAQMNIGLFPPLIFAAGVQPSANVSAWSYGLLTYSPEQTSLSWDAPSTRVTGTGIAPPANLNDPNNFLAIGSAADGTGPINGTLDEIVAFNGPGAVVVTPSMISAVSSNNPAGLNLMWSSATNALMEIRRRVIGSSTWENARAAIGTSFFDSTVAPGERYEYNLNTRISSETTGQLDEIGQFLKASLKGDPLHRRGKLILVVDSTLTNAIAGDLSNFVTNLVGDGWEILRLNAPRHVDDYSSATSFLTNHFNIANVIKPFITSNYTKFGSEIKQILLLGHVPVPHTGFLADDGHNRISDIGIHGVHTGAWSSDLYYGDVDGLWTDSNPVPPAPTPTFPNNSNIAGDGKFDQDFLPTNGVGIAALEIAVSRIDFANLFAFASDTEATLLGKYLRKNARYRTGAITFAPEAIWFENWRLESTIGPQLSTEAISKISPLKQPQSGDVFINNGSFLYSVTSGVGSYDAINDGRVNAHTTANIAAGQTSTNCAFYFLRGSYFPDWNGGNNFLRGVLGTTNGGLATAAFLFQKTWRVDGMGVGLTFGNEQTDIVNGWGGPPNVLQSVRTVEILGDSTLHYPVLRPPGNVTFGVTNDSVTLSWAAAPAPASGYFVYRSTNGILGDFRLVTTNPVVTATYKDTNVPAGPLTYMVRAYTLAATGSGSYTNLSQGVFSPPISGADPSFCCIPAQSVPEDGVLDLDFSSGSSLGPNVTVTPASSNSGLLPTPDLVLSGSGNDWHLQATPLPDQSGTALVTLKMEDGANTIVKTFELNVLPVNDRPTFTKGADVTVAQSAGAQTIANWATAMTPGPPNESFQTTAFVLTNDSPFLFSSQPSINNAGSLAFTPAPNQRGIAFVSAQLTDNGGATNGGENTSYPQNFHISVGLPLDSDGDGLPDDFEEAYGFDPNSAGDDAVDWDGDGMTNLQELAAGTNPKDSRSSLRISSAASQSPTFAVEFNSAAGRSYSVDFNDSFPDDNGWQTLATPVPGTGAAVQQLDLDAGSSDRRIYRVISTGLSGAEIATDYAGLLRLSLLGNSDTFVSIPFFRPAAELGAVVSINGSTVRLRGAPPWQPNQWVYSTAGQSNTYFMLVRSGAAEGAYYTITGNGADTITLDLQGQTLSSLSPGDAVAIIPYWTVGTLFHGGTGVHESPSPGSRQTELLFPNLGGTGINLSAGGTYYFWSGAWRKIGLGAVVKNDDVILPDMYVIVRHNLNVPTTLTTEGTVLPGRLKTHLRWNSASKQDNTVALPRPLGISLNDSDLISSGAFRPSAFPGSRSDELLVFNNSIASKNKAAAATYYYWSGAWRKIGTGAEDKGNDTVFQPGTGVIIRSGSGNGGTVWTHQPGY